MNKINYNPDVLTCLANLSNDEVFTPPQLVSEMLDMLPQELWSNKEAKFLDPFSKTGVFLREITARLVKGLEKEIPDLQTRVDHILKNQIYGIAITELTSFLSRRGLYCSKIANGKYSICNSLSNESGNIIFENIEHTWKDGSCIFCGANKEVYDRNKDLESYAYNFIHTNKPEEVFNMKFDVIIGNPPYQLNDGGGVGSSAMPIYHRFVQQAKKLNPRYLSMIIPSRWFTGGRGLDQFRDEMLKDERLRVLHDFLDASECFPGVEIKGGVCYFLWERDNPGLCNVYTHNHKQAIRTERPLLENGANGFIRYSQAIPIVKKISAIKESSFTDIVSANDPFGFDTRVDGGYKRVKLEYSLKPSDNTVKLYYNGWRKDGLGYMPIDKIKKNSKWINKTKVFIPKAWGSGDMQSDWIAPFIAEPGSCCTETYLVVGPFDDVLFAKNVISYMQTKFFHFLVSLVKNTQNAMKKVYELVPLQDFSKPWTDAELFRKYKLTSEEIEFIESTIKPTEGEDKNG